MATMRERIKAGKLFSDECEGLGWERRQAKRRMRAYNRSFGSGLGLVHRYFLMKRIFGKKTWAWIEPPFYFCYGRHITLGDYCYINVDCSFIDDGEIVIGDHTEFGPNVVIATVGHPIDPEHRPLMYVRKVTIGKNVWVGASVTILPGVTIGDNSVIGAGSLVTKDIPSNVVAYGSPCQVIRPITDEDKKQYRTGCPITAEDLAELHSLEKKRK
ncbi:MAG: sugar O-acetyltransferase [Bacilli bacterium]|jgi:galactoside O-acetyltransferase|nr:sugar O-acetyltransferase [Bacilli bacterium]